MGMKEILDEIKKTVIFLGGFDAQGKVSFCATGFLIDHEGISYLVTAKHVVMKNNTLSDANLCVFLNSKNGKSNVRKLSDIKSKFNIDWIFHEQKDVDVAVIPFPLDKDDDDVKTIPENLFLDSKRLFEIYETFFLSYQPGINYEAVTPIVRTGAISLINSDKTFYIDAFAFPGNSGSPVFLKPSPIRFDEAGISIGGDSLGGKFIGVVGEYLPYQEVAVSIQTGRPRVVFEENTGLSRVWPIEYVLEIFKSQKFREQEERLKDLVKTGEIGAEEETGEDNGEE